MELLSTRSMKNKNPDEYNINNISGLAKRCDWFIRGNNLINITKTDTPKYVFLSWYDKSPLISFLNDFLPKINNNFILIAGDEDCTFPLGTGDTRNNLYKIFKEEEVKILLDNKFLLHIFVENLDTIHPKMTPIPLGMCYPIDGKEHIYGKIPTININSGKYMDIQFDKKNILCFCAHRTRWERVPHRPQFQDRKNVDDLCKGKWKNFVNHFDKISNQVFVKILKQSKFCLCVHGGGMDPCPRFFEAIIHGSIPIIKHSTLDPIFKDRFPVVYVDDWEENCISEKFLEEKLKELKNFYEDKENRQKMLYYLTMDYWWKIITDKYNS